MAEKNKRGFHTVEEPDMEEYERKLREHRVKVVRRTVILIVTVLAVSAAFSFYGKVESRMPTDLVEHVVEKS